MREDISAVLFSEEAIREKVRELGAVITRDYEGKHPLLIGILKGCFVFMSDIARAIDLKCDIDFMAVSSYGNGTSSTGAVKITKDLTNDIEGRHILIIEDILENELVSHDSNSTLVWNSYLTSEEIELVLGGWK